MKLATADKNLKIGASRAATDSIPKMQDLLVHVYVQQRSATTATEDEHVFVLGKGYLSPSATSWAGESLNDVQRLCALQSPKKNR